MNRTTPLPAGDRRHGLPAGVDARCRCARCHRAHSRIIAALASTRLGVPRYRAARRVQALAAIGYTPDGLAAMLEVPRWELAALLYDAGGIPNRRTFARLAAAYEPLSARPVDDLAHTRVWLAPCAWDDIDDPHEHPSRDARYDDDHEKVHAHDVVDHAAVWRIVYGGSNVPGTSRATKEAVVAEWPATGRSFAQLKALTGWNPEEYAPTKVAARTAAAQPEKEGTAA